MDSTRRFVVVSSPLTQDDESSYCQGVARPELPRKEFRRLREDVLDLSQKELAPHLYTTERSIQRWERGVHEVPALAMNRIREMAAEKALGR